MDRQQNYYFFAHDHDATKQDLEISNIKWNSILDRLTPRFLARPCCWSTPAEPQRLPVAAKSKSTVNFDQILKEMQSDYRGFWLPLPPPPASKYFPREKPEWGHGAFTKAVLEGLLEGKADGHGGQGVMATFKPKNWAPGSSIVSKTSPAREQDAIHTQPPELPPFPLYVVR